MSASIQWDTGYSLLFISGLFVWIGVPVINSVFSTSVMTATQTLPVVGPLQLNVLIGSGLLLFGILSYSGFRYR